MAIQGFLASGETDKKELIIVGKTNTPHGKYLVGKYTGQPGIRFVGGIYDFKKLNSVRYYSFAYFHGHSCGWYESFFAGGNGVKLLYIGT